MHYRIDQKRLRYALEEITQSFPPLFTYPSFPPYCIA